MELFRFSKPPITAHEDDNHEDVIPGPPPGTEIRRPKESSLDTSSTEHHIRGGGILASKTDLRLPAAEFAAGCNLLQVAASGDLVDVIKLLCNNPHHINFRDYDRRTALHVAASEGHLEIVQYLVDHGASINRSDRWGGSPLDDAHRHQQRDVVLYLRSKGATTGRINKVGNLITAAAEGDLDEVKMLLSSIQNLDEGDYDKRTALHLAAGEGHHEIVQLLCDAGANANAEDRWGGRPLNDAERHGHSKCVEILKKFGATVGSFVANGSTNEGPDESYMKVEFQELDIIERIGAGAFGEIYKCRWRGTLVAAKVIKTAKIRKEWLAKHALARLRADTSDAEDAMKMLDEVDSPDISVDSQSAIEDFRKEIAVLKSMR